MNYDTFYIEMFFGQEKAIPERRDQSEIFKGRNDFQVSFIMR